MAGTNSGILSERFADAPDLHFQWSRSRRAPGVVARYAMSVALARIGVQPRAHFRSCAGTIRADLATPTGLLVYRLGVWDPWIAVCRALLRPGDGFIDGGANIGLFTIAAAHAVGPQGWVLAYEPAPATAESLRGNVAFNHLHHVDVMEMALSDEAGEMDLVTFPHGSGLSSFAPADDRGGTRIRVKVGTLDGTARPEREPAVVKLDVEGAEVRALHGARMLIQAARPAILLEVAQDHLARQGSSARSLHCLLVDARYTCFRLARNAEVAWLEPTEEPPGSSPDPNLLYLPLL